MGDKGVPCVKVDYLNGNETPNVRRSEKARTLGFIWDFWLDWGITATDFRSMVKNPAWPCNTRRKYHESKIHSARQHHRLQEHRQQ